MANIIYPKPVYSMSPLRRLSLSVVFALLVGLSANAQSAKDSVYLYFPAISSGKEGQVINIPVKVRGFSGLISAQFIVQWDSTRVQYLGVDSFGIASISEPAHFGYNLSNPDRVRFVWFEPDIKPQSINDGGTIFNLKMKLIGKKDESCNIAFVQDGTTIFEFLDKDGNEVKYGFGNGEIKISGSTSSAQSGQDTGFFGKPFPNPFSDETFIQLNLPENQEIKLEIFDISGKKVYSDLAYYGFGTQFVHIKKNNIPSEGIYFYQLSNSRGSSVSGKIINRQ